MIIHRLEVGLKISSETWWIWLLIVRTSLPLPFIKPVLASHFCALTSF